MVDRIGRPSDPKIADQRREEIIQAAINLFSQKGFRNTEVENIAQEANCSKGTIYRYFDNKEDLFYKVADYIILDLIDKVVSPDEMPPKQKIEHIVRRYLSFFSHHPEYIELIIQERSEFRNRKKHTYFKYKEENKDKWKMTYQQLRDDGLMRDISIDHAMEFVGNLLYGTIFTHYFDNNEISLESQTESFLDILFNGLLISNTGKN